MQTRYIPKNATTVRAKNSSAIAYLSTFGARPIAVCYYGKQMKPDAQYSFKSDEARAAWLTKWFSDVARIEASRNERKAQRAADLRKPCELSVGDVLSGSWGYDQTNIEWFEVVAVRGRNVSIRELCVESVETGFMQGKSIPLPGQYRSDKIESRRCMPGGYVRLHSSCTLSKAERNIVAGIPAGFKAAHWTAYA